MKRRCLRIYRKRRKKKLIILILTCILFLGTAAAERGGYLELEQFGSNKKQDIPYQKVSITEEENTEKYYYQQLPTEQRQVYQEILEGVRNHTEEIYVHNADVDETNQIFQKLMKEQSELQPIVDAYKEYKACQQTVEESLMMLDEESDEEMREMLKEELADVIVYSQNLLDKLGLDADEIVNMKMSQNEAKYPVDKAKGNAVKYTEL